MSRASASPASSLYVPRPRRAARVWAAALAAALALAGAARAEEESAPASAPPSHLGAMIGLGQWALGGGNVAVQGNLGWLALEYSHGQAVPLNTASFLLNQSEKDAGAEVRIAWTTGLGVGGMIPTGFGNLRLLVEFKAHHYELQGGDRNSALAYTAFSIGPGLFYDVHFWKGLFIQPSLRWWPTVATTMPTGAALARADGTRVALKNHDSGVFPNLNLGWEF